MRFVGRWGQRDGRRCANWAAVAMGGLALALAAACGRTTEIAGAPDPPTTNRFLERLDGDPADKIDVLLVVDDSPGMRSKQMVLANSLPTLLTRLTDPVCRDVDRARVPKEDGTCPEGSREEFEPVADLHLAVVTSSLGTHGAPASCTDTHGELLATLRDVPSYDELGFLKWDPEARATPAGETDAVEFSNAAGELIEAAGATGCEHEAGLEAWYRFLVDPQPPASVAEEDGAVVLGAVNTAVLEQRAAFLRPDSVVAIVVLSDENDCSVRDEAIGWLVANDTRRFPRGTAACLEDPNDPCCRSCALAEDAPPAGCTALGNDTECEQGALEAEDDPLSLRCFDPQRRFGIDLLYPPGRYVDGLKLPTVLGRPCEADTDCAAAHATQSDGRCLEREDDIRRCEFINPLVARNPNYPELVPRADSSRIYFAAIVGVPWQDVTTEATREDPERFELLPTFTTESGATTLDDRWEWLLGDPETGEAPLDPFMVESIAPRVDLGPHPLLDVGPEATDALPGASPINGHEFTATDRLQYACTFQLSTPRNCATASTPCPCADSPDAALDDPLCQDPSSGERGITQYYDGAHPGPRYLQVARDYGANSIVASVCPKTTDPSLPTAGYAPAFDALVDRFADHLTGTGCLSRALQVDAEGVPWLTLVEATPPELEISCDTPGRSPLPRDLRQSTEGELEAEGYCSSSNDLAPCRLWRLCQLEPAADQDQCQNVPDAELGAGPLAGYCYIDAMQDLDQSGEVECRGPGDADCLGNPELLRDCPRWWRRRLRFISVGVDPPVPHEQAVVFIANAVGLPPRAD